MPVYAYNVKVEFPMAVEADSREEADALAEEYKRDDFKEWDWDAIALPAEFQHIIKRHDDIPDDMEDTEPWGQEPGIQRSLREMFPKVD